MGQQDRAPLGDDGTGSEYDCPVIDSERDLTDPVPHRRVSGRFEGTDKRFTFCFPPKSQWQGRFFHKVYPLDDEHPTGETLAFGADSGAYTVQTNGGGGYQVDAAAARFSREVAARHYDWPGRIHGYIYGGSGGSFQTIAAIENTTDVWDGAVPFVPGTPISIPNNYTVRTLARLVLADKAPGIADAVSPGGHGDPYAGLDDTERAVLLETTRMGLPPRAWEDHAYTLGLEDDELLLGFVGLVKAMDPTYAQDFWNEPGYLGTERSGLGDLFRAARVDHIATITRIDRDADHVPTRLLLDSVPPDPATDGLDHTAYDADGTTPIGALSGALDPATRTLTLAGTNAPEVLDALAEGGRLRTDNLWSLAFRAYHRHQVPARPGFDTWDQFRGPDGKPLHPQRAMEVGPVVSKGVSGGGTHTGAVNGKVIVVANLLDTEAFPWHGDWYAARVREALGDRCDDAFRLWYNDNADHLYTSVSGARAARVVSYVGILQRALRDLSAWVERGVAPARSTVYEVSDGQVALPSGAAARRGVQPVVELTAEGTDRVEIRAGRPVTFTARIEVPPGQGRIVSTEWDFLGTGTFAERDFGTARKTVEVEVTHTYTEPGTYFPVLRATARRAEDGKTPFAGVANLGRVRVVVR
ncbi:PKD domain-containing protein [Streptomyces sp. NPDC006356]